MDALEVEVARALWGKGVEPAAFAELYRERVMEYANYRKWIPEKNEAAKGTLFWEFAKKVAAILGVGPNALFNTALTNLLFTSLAKWQLDTLLRD